MLLIYQAMMMAWEAVLEYYGLLLVLLTVFVAAWLFWLLGGNRPPLQRHRMSLLLAAVVAGVGFFVLPLLFSASLSDLTYWVDLAFHLAMVLAVFVYAYLLLLPSLSRLMSHRG